MGSSITHSQLRTSLFELPAWKTFLAVGSAVLLGLLFIVAGVWKVTDPFGAASRLTQAKLPAMVSLPSAILLGIAETFAGVLLMVPRFRRWGAMLTGVLLVAFMIYIGIFYNELRGEECSCFPWVKRAVGPGFFIGDGVMLALAVFAGVWSRPSESLRSAWLVLAAVAVFAGVSYGAHAARQTGLKAPDTITVNGQPFNLQQGRTMLYFFDPECSHCDAAAKTMSKYNWAPDVKIIVIPTRMPQFAGQFLDATGLKAQVSNDLAKLQETFKFTAGPYGTALVDGRQKAPLPTFEGDEPEKTLKQLGFVK